MSPKTKFNKEDIIAAAFEIAREEGFAAITARSVAKRLGSSVAPIYVHFAAIDDLIEAVVQRVFALSGELLAKQKGPHLFENIGKASLEFAREYPVLLRELVLQPNPYMNSYAALENAMVEAMAGDAATGAWSVEERRQLFLKMRVFQLGLSVMVANGHVPAWLDGQAIEDLLMEVGEELLLARQIKLGEKRQ